MNSTNRKPSFGSISHGTLRPKDLIPAFVAELEYLAGRDAVAAAFKSAGLASADVDVTDVEGLTDDATDWLLESLFEALQELALPFTYFGSHVGDGSDFGFWPDHEGIAEAVYLGELVAIDDPSAIPSGGDEYADCDGFVYVNDHGNTTLYDRAGNVVWDCV